ncbi:MAG: winged helix-turn-helix transcriptional regulator, partial [Desulfurococcales archaeon]|nr:winged helix-turn-helix transcriptional regulator [Desulfurococcales archaeon]
MRKLAGSVFLLTIILLASLPLALADTPVISSTYDCRDGIVYVVTYIKQVQGLTNLTIPENPGTYEDSVIAVNQNGTPLPVLVGGGEITVFVNNETQSIQLSYIIYPNSVSDTYLLEIHASGKSTIILPTNGSLVYASDSPNIYANYSRITLSYINPGVYTIYYSITTHSTTSTIPEGTSTTTQSQTGSTNTTGSTGSNTQSTTTSQEGTGTAGSQSEGNTVSGSYSQSTTISQGTSTVGTSQTSAPIHRTMGKDTWMYLILASILVAVILAIIILSRKKKIPENNYELVDTRIDERDKLLLNLIKKGGHSISSLAKESGLRKSVVWRRIRKLEEMGLIETSKGIGKVEINLTD